MPEGSRQEKACSTQVSTGEHSCWHESLPARNGLIELRGQKQTAARRTLIGTRATIDLPMAWSTVKFHWWTHG